jgi:hypothetical protein
VNTPFKRLRRDASLSIHVSEQQFLTDALHIIDEAENSGLKIRILGALCGYIKNQELDPKIDQVYRTLGRLEGTSTLFTDLDLVAYSSQRGKIMDLFEKKLKLVPNRYFNMARGHHRLMYEKTREFQIDLFFDRLQYSHNVEFGSKPGNGRLELDYPTISLADFVLEKLQIHQINRKDLVDIIILLKNHEVADHFEKGKVDAGYIAQVLSDDWGFWYDATQNIQKIRNELSSLARKLPDHEAVLSRLDQLSAIIDACPKTPSWNARSKSGTSTPWFTEVFEIGA